MRFRSDYMLVTTSLLQLLFLTVIGGKYSVFEFFAVMFYKQFDDIKVCVYVIFAVLLAAMSVAVIRDTMEALKNVAKIILFVCSRPVELAELDFLTEFNNIQTAIAEGSNSDYYRVEIAPDASKSGFVKALEKHKPAILHIAMHASLGHGLYFQRANGTAMSVSADDFAEIMSIQEDEYRPKAIILSACHSFEIAQKSKQYCNANAIGTKELILDAATPIYARNFYKVLRDAESDNIRYCHKKGKLGIKLTDPPFPPVNNVPAYEIFELV